MFIKSLKHKTYDVFVGNGWNQWARVRLDRDGLNQVDGAVKLDQRTILKVKERIMK